ncbi:cupin domain-containing protein [Devosia sp.]|uniref:cupin domain-containing protein n=1 Tax=Devosia sp. TaxID=1871048 RepID=UPI002F16826B
MSTNAFFVSPSKAALVANDAGEIRRFEADSRHIPAGAQVPVRAAPEETVYYVEAGTFEFMVNGAAGFVTGGNFVRIPAGVPHAYRNAGHRAGRLFVRTIPKGVSADPLRLVIEIAAA